MEFSQHSISPMDDPRLPHLNQNPNSSPSPRSSILPQYTLQATPWQAGTPTVFDQRIMAISSPNARVEPLMIGNAMNVREIMLQKEIEKGKIRQEIIASEIVRRRILEAEVRRELMIERTMALRRVDNDQFSGEDSVGLIGLRSTYVDNAGHMLYEHGASSGQYVFDVLPFHRPLQLHEYVPKTSVGKERLIVLEKPKSNLSGSKRKADEEPLAGVGGGGSESSGVCCRKNTPEEDWSCALCHVSMTSERGLQDHLQGKKHKAKEARLRADKLDRIKCKESDDKPAQVREGSDTKAQNEVSLNELVVPVEKKLPAEDLNKDCKLALQKDKQKQKDRTRFKFWCEICQIGTHSETVMEHHKLGKKHRDHLKDIKVDNDAGDAAPPSTALAETVVASLEDTVEKNTEG